jgi:hypothetical protein
MAEQIGNLLTAFGLGFLVGVIVLGMTYSSGRADRSVYEEALRMRDWRDQKPKRGKKLA